MPAQTHEDFSRGGLSSQGSSDRSFGLVMAAALAILGLWPLKLGQPYKPVPLIAGAVFLGFALIRPSLLHPLNRVWTSLGLLMGRVVHPIIMGVLFFLVFTPVGLFMRWTRRDALRLKLDPDAPTYWITRRGSGSQPGSMVRQF